MPAQSPNSENAQGEQKLAGSQFTSPSFSINKIPLLNNRSRSFFLFLVAGVAIVGLIVVFFLVNRGYLKPGKSEPDPNLPAAIVNGASILNKDYQAYLDSQKGLYSNLEEQTDGQAVTDVFLENLPQQALNDLIQETLLTRYLAEKDIQVTDEDVNNFIQEIIDEQFGKDRAAYEEFVGLLGSSHEERARGIRRDLLKQKAIEIENIEPQAFDNWYSDLIKNSDIEIKVEFQSAGS